MWRGVYPERIMTQRADELTNYALCGISLVESPDGIQIQITGI
jgi:hypothetical protein